MTNRKPCILLATILLSSLLVIACGEDKDSHQINDKDTYTQPYPPSNSWGNIIITEYVEGSGNNKALEISNLGSSDVDLGAEAYKLVLFTNGSETEHGERKLELSGVLSASASLVVYNPAAEAIFLHPDDGFESNVTFFDGNDAIVLTRDGIIVDSLGRIGEDPGYGWTDPNNPDFSTVNKTLRRMASVTTGDTVVDDEWPGMDTQWIVFDENTADGLGCSGESACGAQ